VIYKILIDVNDDWLLAQQTAQLTLMIQNRQPPI